MAIVLSQTDQPSTQRRDFEEELVAILLMKDGLEVTIIGDIANIEAESTDALCLEGVRGNLLFISWYSQDDAEGHLGRAGVIGSFHGAPKPPTLPIATPGHYDPFQRAILCFDLSPFERPIDARRELLRTLDHQRKGETPNAPAPKATHTSHPAPPATKPMPKRQETSTTHDPLDSLLDAFDEMEL